MDLLAVGCGCRRQREGKMDEDKLVAATLASAIFSLYGSTITAETAFPDAPARAAKIYFDCLDTMAQVRKERRAAPKAPGEYSG
jgi:hypothetical protein